MESRSLRPRYRDPDAALDSVRGAAIRHRDVVRRADDNPGARLRIADLVYAVAGWVKEFLLAEYGLSRIVQEAHPVAD